MFYINFVKSRNLFLDQVGPDDVRSGSGAASPGSGLGVDAQPPGRPLRAAPPGHCPPLLRPALRPPLHTQHT